MQVDDGKNKGIGRSELEGSLYHIINACSGQWEYAAL